jgi:hypothetical protein
MSNLGGMSNAAAFGVMGAALFFILAYLADCYTTMIGTQHGMVEKAFITKNLMKLVKKFGWNLQLLQVLSGAAVLFIGGFFTDFGAAPAAAYFGIVGAGEAVQAFLNYRLLKKAGISLK